MTSSRLLARNALLNLAGQVIPMVAAVVAIPLLIRHLGATRFGVLTLVWAGIGYFALFDLGLGRALTQVVAARLGASADDDDLGAIAWTALWLMLALGVLGGAVLALCSPWIINHGLNIPPELRRESLLSFYLLVLSLPFVVSTAGLRGLLEAHQDFGLATALRIPLALFTFVGPLAALPFSSTLVPIVAILFVGRMLSWLAHLVVCLKRYGYLRARARLQRRAVGPLIRYGGWMTVSNIVSPLMAYLDRFFIGAILPLAAVAHYVTPQEVVTKLSLVPIALIAALFPAFATTFVTDRARTAALFERSFRAVLMLMFPILLVIVLFAREGLTAWVGADFAAASTPVLQWLGIGIFINALAQPPFAMLQGIGRPDLTAKLHVAELPVYVASLWWLAQRYGIVGVAAAWSIRATVDSIVLLSLAFRRVPVASPGARRMLLGALAGLLALTVAVGVAGTAMKLSFLIAAVAGYLVLGWSYVMGPEERDALRLLTRLARRRPIRPT